jgi:hypothetical protein
MRQGGSSLFKSLSKMSSVTRISAAEIRQFCKLPKDGQSLMRVADAQHDIVLCISQLNLSARGASLS